MSISRSKLSKLFNNTTKLHQKEHLSLSRVGAKKQNLVGWFRPCPGTSFCPKHNPKPRKGGKCEPPPPVEECTPIAKPKCLYQKGICSRNHGLECTCPYCMQCKCEECNWQCSLSEMHGAQCTCPKCLEPHDLGCNCPKCMPARCRKSKCGKEILEKTPIICCHYGCAEKAKGEDDVHRIAALGRKCVCLLHHSKDCQCKDCQECMKLLCEAKRVEAERDVRVKKMKDILVGLEMDHGRCCPCIRCTATRQRVEITLCNEHLVSCKCFEKQGRACRCAKCRECLRKKQVAMITKSEDYW